MVQEDIIWVRQGVAGASEQLGDGSVVVCNGDIVVSPIGPRSMRCMSNMRRLRLLRLPHPRHLDRERSAWMSKAGSSDFEPGVLGRVLSGDFVGVQIPSSRSKRLADGGMPERRLPALERGGASWGGAGKSFEDIGTLGLIARTWYG